MTEPIRTESELTAALRDLRGVRDDRLVFRLAESLRAAWRERDEARAKRSDHIDEGSWEMP